MSPPTGAARRRRARMRALTPGGQATGADPAGVRGQPPTPSGRQILVIDDSAGARDLLTGVLRKLTGFEVIRARNGELGLASFREHAPLLTFLDIHMDGMNGLEVLRHIRNSNPEAFVVMVSAESSAHNVRKAFEGGAGAFVVKPFRTIKIIEALENFTATTGIHIDIWVE